MRTLPFAGLLLGSFVSAASAQPSAGPAELSDRQISQVTAGAGAGNVSMQDFHFVMKQNSFVMRQNKASPK